MYTHIVIFTDLRPTVSLQPGAYSLFIMMHSIVRTFHIFSCFTSVLGRNIIFAWQVVDISRDIGLSPLVKFRLAVLPFNNQQQWMQRAETNLVTVGVYLFYSVDIFCLLLLALDVISSDYIIFINFYTNSLLFIQYNPNWYTKVNPTYYFTLLYLIVHLTTIVNRNIGIWCSFDLIVF